MNYYQSTRSVVFICVVTSLVGYLITLTVSFAQETDVKIAPFVSETIKNSTTMNFHSKNDTVPPSINIIYPSYPPTVTVGKITISGSANDSDSGIRNISSSIHTFPFSGDFPVLPASQPIPMSSNNWSHWYVPLVINTTGTYRVVIEARDNAGNVNYAETTINVPLPKENSPSTTKNLIPKISFVRPTFTEAAYQEHGFYRFYFKYGFPPFGKNITTDLDMLTVKTPRSISEFVDENELRHLSNITALVPIKGTELSDVSQDSYPYPQKFWLPFINNVKKIVPNATLTVMRDEDVHDGHIFRSDNKSNAYDILLLFHNEYVTQQEYNNLRQFVSNGGTIVFMDANALYAEVHYDRTNNAVTLVKGHSWEFDGKMARRDVTERWYNETKKWVGGNYLLKTIDSNVTFANNPFNYTHFEEQFVNNPNDKIIIDYGVKFGRGDYLRQPSLNDTKIATYSIQYGKGKVLMLGLSSRLLANNDQFMDFFDKTILAKALCPKFLSCSDDVNLNYLYGCTKYADVVFHCDPISNDFESYQVLASFKKVASITRQPDYVGANYGKGVYITGAHRLESLRANIINAYKSKQFSIYISFRPDKYDKTIGNPSVTLISYKNGIYNDDNNTSGWEIELVPNDSTSMKKVRFTVFNTNGHPTHSKEIEIPTGKFSEITGTFDGKAVRIFVNDSLRSEVPFIGVYNGNIDNNNFLKVTGDAYCTCYLASGVVDEVRVYNYSLNNPQVSKINNQTKFFNKGLVGYWKFDGDLKDYSEFKNDMFYNTIMGGMAFTPDGRLFYTEKNSGNVRIMKNNIILDKPFASIPNIHVDFEQGLLGIAIDSKFAENHFVYAYYTYDDYSVSSETSVWGKVVRFTEVNNTGTDETTILDRIPASVYGYHAGGALTFNKVDDKIYLTVGDAIDGLRAQNFSELYGKILRINRDGSIPTDNPFLNSPVFTYGHRNMYGIAFDDNGLGIVSEPGSSSYDEINLITKGGNYGWPIAQLENTPPDGSHKQQLISPTRTYYIANTPTQIIYYNGDKYPELKGKFIGASFTGDLYAYRISKEKKLLEEIKLDTSVYPSKEVVGIAVSPDGEIYFGAYDIYKLNKLDSTSKEQIMYPISVNSSNVKVSAMDYTKDRNELTIDLTDRHDSSAMLVRSPDSLIDMASARYQCHVKNTHQMSDLADINSHCLVKIDSNRQNNYALIEFAHDAPLDFQLIIRNTEIIPQVIQ